jgi:hypothetical protein
MSRRTIAGRTRGRTTQPAIGWGGGVQWDKPGDMGRCAHRKRLFHYECTVAAGGPDWDRLWLCEAGARARGLIQERASWGAGPARPTTGAAGRDRKRAVCTRGWG